MQKISKPPKETLKQSLGFSAIGSIGAQLISLVSFIILARILSPQEFGLMAMVSIFTAFVTIFVDMGMGSALIHHDELTDAHTSTAFWFNLFMGFTFCFIMMLSADEVASFFDRPELKSIILVVAWMLPVNALFIVPLALLQKKQDFKKVAIVELGAVAISFLGSLTLAMNNFGVWALVWGLFIASLSKCAFAYVAAQWRPTFFLQKKAFQELWGFSSYLLGASVVNYFISNVDSVLVGKALGANTLGLYKYSYQLTNLPSKLVSTVFSRVFFSSYARYKEDKERIKNVHFKAVRMIAFIIFPALIILSSVSDIFVQVVLGEKWGDMSQILSFMCFIFLLDSVGAMSGPLFLSQGKTKALFWVNIGLRTNQLVAMFIGIQFGLEGLLWGLLLVRLINFFPLYYFVGRMINFGPLDFLYNILPPFVSASIAWFFLWAVKGTLFYKGEGLISLLVLVSSGAAVYFIVSVLLQKKVLLEFKSMLTKKIGVA